MALPIAVPLALTTSSETRAAGADTAIYWSDLNQNTISKITTASPNASVVLNSSSTPSISNPRPIATDGTHLFVANSDGNQVIRSNVDGTGAAELAGLANKNIGAFFANATHLFYASWNGGIFRSNKDGSASVQLVTPNSNGAPAGEYSGVYATGDTVYFTYYGSGGGTSGKIYKRSYDANGASGSVALVFDSVSRATRTYESIWLVGSRLFVGTPAGIDVVSTSGAWSELLQSGAVKNLTAADGYIYFTAPSGTVKRIAIDGGVVETVYTGGGFTFGVAAAPAFVVSYSPNGATSGSPPASSDHQTGATVTVSANTGSLAKRYCSFDGWNTQADGLGAARVPGSTFLMGAESITLHANWDCAYPVTYVANGGTGSVPVDANTYAAGATFISPGNSGGLVKTGYQFSRWQVVSGGTPSLPATGALVTVSGPVTMSAVWVGGPLEFAQTPTGPAMSNIDFPDTVSGQAATLTIHVRNVGSTSVSVGGVSGNGGGVSRTGGTCPVVSGSIQPYAGNQVNVCTYTFTWTASTPGVTVQLPFRVNYELSNTVTLSGTPVYAARTPAFDTPVATAGGFTVNVTNWDNAWTWAPSASTGTVTAGTPSGTSLPLTVTGLGSGATSTITVVTSRSGYAGGSATVSGTASLSSNAGGSTPPVFVVPPTTTTPPATTTPPTTRPTVPGGNVPAVPVTQPNGSSPDPEPGEATANENGQSTPVTVERVGDDTWRVSGDDFQWDLRSRVPGTPANPLGGSPVIGAGSSVNASGSGFAPGTMIDLWLMPDSIFLGVVEVKSDGTFHGSVTLPPNLGSGKRTIQANGTTTDGKVRSLDLGVRVEARSPTLPVTGTSSDDRTGVALALLVAGLLLVRLRSRRRSMI